MKMRMLLLIAVLLAVWTGCALAEQVVTPGEAIVPPQATMQPENTPEPTAQPENKPEPTQQPVGTPVPSVQPTQVPAQGRAAIGNMEAIEIERKKTMTLAIPVEFGAGGESWYSNMKTSTLATNGGNKNRFGFLKNSVQFSSVTQSCPTFCDPMNCSMPGLPVHHQLLGSTYY